MKKLIKLIRTELPSPIEKRQNIFLGIGTALLLTAPLTLPIYHEPVLMIMFIVLGVVYVAYALCSRSRIIKGGYETQVFRVYDYTYSCRFARSPSGMLIRPVGGNECLKYHLAVTSQCGLPEIGSIVRVYVPKSVKPKAYGDRYYYPVVLGYEITETETNEI